MIRPCLNFLLLFRLGHRDDPGKGVFVNTGPSDFHSYQWLQAYLHVVMCNGRPLFGGAGGPVTTCGRPCYGKSRIQTLFRLSAYLIVPLAHMT